MLVFGPIAPTTILPQEMTLSGSEQRNIFKEPACSLSFALSVPLFTLLVAILSRIASYSALKYFLCALFTEMFSVVSETVRGFADGIVLVLESE